jgi:hypothetical protein
MPLKYQKSKENCIIINFPDRETGSPIKGQVPPKRRRAGKKKTRLLAKKSLFLLGHNARTSTASFYRIRDVVEFDELFFSPLHHLGFSRGGHTIMAGYPRQRNSVLFQRRESCF